MSTTTTATDSTASLSPTLARRWKLCQKILGSRSDSMSNPYNDTVECKVCGAWTIATTEICLECRHNMDTAIPILLCTRTRERVEIPPGALVRVNPGILRRMR